MTFETVLEKAEEFGTVKYTKMYNRVALIEAFNTDSAHEHMGKTLTTFNSTMNRVFLSVKKARGKSWKETLIGMYETDAEMKVDASNHKGSYKNSSEVVKKMNCKKPGHKEIAVKDGVRYDSKETGFVVALATLADNANDERYTSNQDIDFSEGGYIPKLEDNEDYFGYAAEEEEEYYEKDNYCDDLDDLHLTYVDGRSL